MRKRWLMVGMVILLVTWLLSGCGIAQEEYDTVVADLSTAQGELQSVKAELASAQAKVSELTSSLEKAGTELEAKKAELGTSQDKASELTSSLEKAETELEAAQSELETTKKSKESIDSEYQTFKSEVKSEWSRFDALVGLQWNIVAYWSAAAKGDEDLIQQRHVNMVTFVEKVGDSTCTSLWEQAMSATEKGQDTLYMESYAALMDRSMFLVTSQAKAIRASLAD